MDLPKRKRIRLKNYDYSSDGFYFVTICTFGKSKVMERIRSRAERILLSLPERFPGVEIDYYVFMPDHVHVILQFQEVGTGLGEVLRVFKAMVSRECRNQVQGHPVWQRNFYEHVVKSEEALLKIREYIINNPFEEKLDFYQFYQEKKAPLVSKKGGLDESSPREKR